MATNTSVRNTQQAILMLDAIGSIVGQLAESQVLDPEQFATDPEFFSTVAAAINKGLTRFLTDIEPAQLTAIADRLQEADALRKAQAIVHRHSA